MNGLTAGPDLDMLIRSANEGWGFSDGTGSIEGTNGFWVDGGKPKVGTMDVSAFLKLTDKAKFDFINSGAFPDSVRTRMSAKIDANYSANAKASVEKGLPSRRVAEAEFMDGNTVKPTQVSAFSVLMDKFSLKAAFGGVVGVMGIAYLLKLAEARSGCFLVGPEGQEEKVSAGDCSCNGGTGNPNAGSCCAACNATGDSFLCAGEVSDMDPPPPEYVCPSEVVAPVSGRARQFARATISAQAAKARDKAASMASKSNFKTLKSTSEVLADGCVSCGCITESWTLCHREVSPWDVLGDMLGSMGLMLLKGLNDVWELVEDGIKALAGGLGAVMKMVMMIVGGAVAVGVVIAVIVVVVKVVKKKKLRNS